MWATVSACQGKLKPDAMQSFPSGHTGNSFAAATFLALYLNAKLKAFSDYHTNFAKQMAIVAPLIGAGLIAAGMVVDRVSSINPSHSTKSSLTGDQNHHATDVLLSILLGVLCGLLAYRAQYYSLFNYRNNHLPLPYREPNSFTSCFGSKVRSPETGFGATTPNNHHPHDTTPDKYLAVRWPFDATEKRGPVDTKKPRPQIPPRSDPGPVEMTSTSSGNRPRDVDGNSSVNAVWSMSRASHVERSSSAGQATTIRRNSNAERSSATASGSGARAAEAPSVRDREIVGSGVGSEVAEMV